MKLLCIGDIHLGRQPSRLPAALVEQLGGRVPGPAAAWGRAVDYAIEAEVDGVLLAGDVVEQEDDFFEAYRDLSQGVERLAAKGIPVLGVTGNHDVRVLPRLAERVEGFRLLGAHGHWEEAALAGADGQRLRVLGWSFPEPQVHASPLAQGLPPASDVPTVGLLHCDLDQPGSRYAPVARADLAAAPVDAWLLGHIHKPDDLSGERPIGYLGSLTGLDPGERGVHGPWLLEHRAADGLALRQIPLAPLQWVELDVPVDDLAEGAGVQGAITDAIARLHAEQPPGPHRPEAVGCRLRLTGRSELRAEIEQALASDDPRAQPFPRDGIVYFVHAWRMEVLPRIDLDELASGTDPAALLARKLQVLRRDPGDEARQALIDAARPRLAAVTSDRHFAPLGESPPGDEAIAGTLERAALQALDQLLAQGEARP